MQRDHYALRVTKEQRDHVARLSTSSIMPFHTYRQCLPDGEPTRDVDLVASVEHFYQSERFRGVDELLRREILLQPTPREARKLAIAKMDKQHQDWTKMRGRVMVCGLWFQILEHPSLAQQISRGDYGYGGKSKYWKANATSSGAFIQVPGYIEKRLNRPVTVFVYGFDKPASEFAFNGNMDLFFRRKRPDVLSLGNGNGVDALAEKWAISRQIPILRRSQMKRLHRLKDETVCAVLSTATHAVLLGQKGHEDVLRLERLATTSGLSVRVANTPRQESTPGNILSLGNRGAVR